MQTEDYGSANGKSIGFVLDADEVLLKTSGAAFGRDSKALV